MADPFKIAVLISGGGTTLENLIQCEKEGRLEAEISLVISSSPDAGGNRFADGNGIPLHVVTRGEFSSTDGFSEAIFGLCRSHEIALVVMGGFLKRVTVPDDFLNRVINIHPSLIPAFSGKGFYGLRVHQAVLDHGCTITGCTVHFVDDQFDHGPVICQHPVNVLPDDDAVSLQQRVFARECEIYPDVINRIARQQVAVHGRVVKLAKD